MPSPSSKSSSDEVFHARRGRLIYLIVFFMVLGLCAVPWKLIAIGLHGSHALNATVFIISICPSFFLIGMALILFIGIMRGLPYLSISSAGVTYKTAFGAMQAHWNSLAPFKVTDKSTGLFTKRPQSAASYIMGKEVSKNLRKAKHFKIPNQFYDNLENIVAALNQQRSIALAGASPEVLNPKIENDVAIESLSQLGDPAIGTPWVTLGILGVLTAVYIAEFIFSVKNGGTGVPDGQVLMALGALNRTAVLDDHEWYRLFTAFMLHANFMHLFLNGIALFFGGLVLEKLLGRVWFFAFFIMGGVGGSLMSLAIDPENVFSTGASGAIMALFSALFTMSFRLPSGSRRVHVQIQTLRILLPALLPAGSHSGLKTDVAAHFGGFLAGLIAAIVLLKLWPSKSFAPPGKAIAKKISVAGLAAIIISFGCMTLNQHGLCTAHQAPETAIQSCSGIIQANKAGPKKLASALAFRGIAYLKQTQNDLALHDVNQAVELDPTPATLAAQGTVLTAMRRYDEAIQAYTRTISLIKDDRLLPDILAVRAVAYTGNGNNAAAEKDIDRALSIDPSNALSLTTLCNIYLEQGDYAKAIANLDQAIQKNPSDSDLYWARGEAKIFQGTPELAVADMTTAVNLDPTKDYKVLWLHIAHAKADQNDQVELQRNNARLSPDKWPQPLVALYLNKSTIDKVIAKAKTGDPGTQNDQMCEANFYIAELYLQSGAKMIAKSFLQDAFDNCPADYIERAAARAELKNIGDLYSPENAPATK